MGFKRWSCVKGHTGSVTSVCFSANDGVIASGSDSGQILLYSLITGNQFASFNTIDNQVKYFIWILRHSKAVKGLSFSPFRKWLLACCSDDGSVFIWDTNGKSLHASFPNVHSAPGHLLIGHFDFI